MGIGAAAIIGGGMAIGALGSYLGSRSQAGAAERSADAQRQLGREAADIIAGSEYDAGLYLRGGAADQQRYLGQAADIYGTGANRVAGLGERLGSAYQPRIDAGDEAMQRLRSTLLGGDMSDFETSPGYRFRRQEGQKAIERAAAAAGSYGSGANIKDLTRFGQGIASQEYDSYLSRLLGMQQIGSQAAAQRAQTAMGIEGMRSALLGQQAGVIGQRGAVAGGLGSALAGLRTGTAANRANALTGSGSQAIQYDLAGAQASAQGMSGIGNAIQQGTMLYALMGMPGMGGSSGPETYNL